MSEPLAALNRYPSWKDVLSLLGIKQVSSALPVRISCPLCRTGRLFIFADPVLNGQWHYCYKCHHRGSMLELAAAVWKVSLRAAAQKAANEGCYIPGECLTLEFFQRYEEAFYNRWRRYTDFWQEKKNPDLSLEHEAADLMNTLKLRFDRHVAWADEGLGEVLGFSHCKDVEACASPKAAAHNANRDRSKASWHNPSASRVFSGHGWKNVIFFPLYNQPGRISGLCCIGRQGKPEDVCFKFLGSEMFNRQSSPDAGLAFHPDILSNKGAIFGFDDPLVYLRVHAAHFMQDPTALPIVLWTAQERWRTRWSWRMFGNRQKILWAPRLTAAVVAQAAQMDGYLSGTGSSTETDDDAIAYAVKQEPDMLLHLMRKQALHWVDRLNQDVPSMEDSDVEELFLGIQLSSGKENYARLLAKCNRDTQQRVRAVMDSRGSVRVIVMDNAHIEERVDGWYKHAAKGEELISDAVLRIDRAVYHPGMEKTLYQGRVLYQGEEIPFSDNSELIEAKPLEWMKNLLIKEQKGLLSYNPKWNTKLVSIAKQFHTPGFLTGVEQIGWSDEKSAFVLPRYMIHFGGEVENHDFVLTEDLTPAVELPEPETVSPAHLGDLLDDTPANNVFWAAWCSLTANILGGAVNFPTRGIAVVGDPALGVARAAATACGCRSLSFFPVKTVRDREQAHRWPVQMNWSRVTKPEVVREWLMWEADRQCMTKVEHLQASCLLLNGGWHTINYQEPITIQNDIGTVAQPLLPTYLQHLCKRKFDNLREQDELVLDVIEDVANWLESMNFDGMAVRNATSVLLVNDETGHGDEFGYCLWQMVALGQVRVKPEEFGYTANTVWYVKEPNSVFVVKSDLVQLLRKHARLQLDTEQVTNRLAAAKILLGSTELFGHEGWLLDRGWWDLTIRQHKAKSSGRLKLRYG